MEEGWSCPSQLHLPSGMPYKAFILAILVLPISLLIYDFFTAALRTSFPNVRGPRREFVSGNLKEMIRRGSIRCHKQWMLEYGNLFTFSLGRREYLCVTDPDLVRELLENTSRSFQDRPLPPVRQKEDLKALIFSQGSYWATARGAVMPVFHTDKLALYGDIMHRCSATLIQKLEAAAEKTDSVDVAPLIQDLEIDVLGEAAFGIEFNVQEGKQSKLAQVLTEKARGGSRFRTSVLISLYFGKMWGSVAESFCRSLPWTEDAAVAHKMRFLMKETGALAKARGVDPEAAQMNDHLTLLSRQERVPPEPDTESRTRLVM